ncbi:response regulator transcription factor [Caulobacter mirabilis]|uniref:DNA-binding response regulator n=1 Tax=Caulobacter mirabilis TaxID=69666 RepID=A0A2D2B0V2_9CAUL|nr:response regulator [Caulobacter mirabilis]ATQ43870.1 DNA-binding response regulator [Caulobacter mirabilis]
MPPLIHIIDDDALLREALRGLFRSADYETMDHASIEGFLAADRPNRPGCVIVDVRLPDGNGLDLLNRMSALGMSQPVLVMTGYGDIPMSVRAMKAGAADFLTKPIRDRDLFDAALAAVAADQERWAVEEALLDLQRLYGGLTARERQVVDLVALGRLNKQIAGDLSLSESTVKTHRRSAMRKLKARTVADLVRMADRLKAGV